MIRLLFCCFIKKTIVFLADSNLIGKRLEKYPVINSNVKLAI